jgi:uncharacterized protein (TIRG00374 family)
MISKKRIYFLLRFLLSLFFIALIISRVNLEKVLALVPTIKLHFVLIGLIWLLIDRIIMSYRWDILLRAKGINISILSLIRLYFLASFWGAFLPSSVAPDVVKVYVASKKHDANTSDVLSSVVVDRFIGVFSLATVAFLSFAVIFFSRRMQANANILAAILAVLAIMAFFVLFDRLPLKKVSAFLHLSRKGTVWQFLAKFYNSCREYRGDRAAILRVFTVSFVNHIFSILIIYLLTVSLGLQISVLHLFVFVPLVNFLIMIPISLGGLGIQEGAYVYFFSQVGVSTQEALTVALIFRALMITASLPGGAIYALEGFRINRVVG